MNAFRSGPVAAFRLLGSGLLVLLLSAAPVAGQSSAPRSPDTTVTGDLIVKFRDSTDAGAALAAVVGGTRAMASAAPVAARLSSELGVPLKLVQVTSGREALLAIDREVLLRSLAQRALREPGVARAVPTPRAATVLPSEQASVRIELKPQASAQALAGKLDSGELLRPSLVTQAGGATLLSYDMAGLTLAVLERLQKHAEVEYAQANRILRAVDGGKPR
ncbi:MAG: hypothetical protein OEY03_06410 [Rhizobacter sp.]|nr:hypothetical protein [Rhizobacter sp.]